MKKLLLFFTLLLGSFSIYANSKVIYRFLNTPSINYTRDINDILMVNNHLYISFNNASLNDSSKYLSNDDLRGFNSKSSNLPYDATYITNRTSLITTLPIYWVKQTAVTTGMPYGIEVYNSTTNYSYNNGPVRKMNAYCVVVDPKYLDFKPTYAKQNKLPATFISDEKGGTTLACMNTGFFGVDVAFSMLRYNGLNYTNNIASLNRIYNGNPTVYYVTRAAFGLAPDLRPNVTWVYPISGVAYSYNMPSPNDINNPPKPQPTVINGVVWNSLSAVGGAPMLIKNGTVRVTDTEELIVIDNTTPRARTAIGYTANGKIVMLAAEGENAGISDGLTLVELANYMKDMGCVGAINLDGGSSTMLRVAGKEMIRPSSAGLERAMLGVILIKAKNQNHE